MTLFEFYINALNDPWETIGNNIQYRLDKINHILYLQGSVEKSDWVYNFDFPVQAYRDADIKWRVHRGFMNAWKTAEEEVLPLMLQYNDLTIIGYSHGGALACLAHEDYLFYKQKQPRTIVFGCPRVLWGKDSKKILSRFSNLQNIKNIGDIVTKVPPKWMGYIDAGVVTYIGTSALWSGHNPEQYIGGLYGQ